MTGRGCRAKGAAGEREFLRLLGGELGVALARNLVQTREGGADCLEVVGFAIEVKRVQSLSRPMWWAQAREQAARVSADPMLAYRRNREPWNCFIHTAEGKYREGTIADAANAIRERWATP